jgi:light-regulated signal transduction histidine kinase (bacteriophytochrome)
VKDFQMDYGVPNVGQKVLLLNARQIQQRNGEAPLILLSIEDITQSRAVLLKLNAELKHIAYATSHDLQEPLRMVVSYTQLLARQYKGRLDAEADTFIGFAVEGAVRMETLLKDLRDYWSVNKQGLETSVLVECESVLEKALHNLRRPIQESGALVTHEPLPTIKADEIPLLLLLQNLIGNAIKYRRTDEPPHIHLRALRTNGLWEFSVTDNGIGIEEEYLTTIFAPFKRLHALSKYPGSGLGLAICQKIVEGLGGQIWAESSYGKGSTFHFTIPATEGDS